MITKKVKMNLQQPSFVPAIHAVQYDSYSRNVELQLYSADEIWEVPEGAAVLVRYSKPDGKGGVYDTLPDGTQCWHAEGNVLTIALAPQVLTVPGPVRLSVSLLEGEIQITTFAIMLDVEESVDADIEESEEYRNVTTFLPAPSSSKVGQYFQISAVDHRGRVTAVEAVDLAANTESVLYSEQALTAEQKTQARVNIGAASVEEVVTALEGGDGAVNFLDGLTWKCGYLTGSSVNTTLSSQMHGEAYTVETIPVSAGETYVFQYRFTPYNSSSTAWWAMHTITADGKVSRTILPLTDVVTEGNVSIYTTEYTPGVNVTGIRLSGRTAAWYGNPEGRGKTREECDAIVGSLAPELFIMTVPGSGGVQIAGDMRLLPVVEEGDDGKALKVSNGRWILAGSEHVYSNPNLRAVNHRGYCTVAPENTLSAYRLSKKMGFTYVECDVTFTKDGAAVLLHDSTVDRTSNGSGSIAEMTLQQVKALDFGSWMGQDYAGETIPTFEEFILLCKQIGLHPYIEIKGGISAANAEYLVNAVKRYGMQNKVTWISFNSAALTSIKALDAAARLGFVIQSASEENIAIVDGLKDGENEVFLDISHSALTEDFLLQCVEKDIPLEVWTIDQAETLAALDPYITGYTSDKLQANVVLYDAFG